jgi:alpha-aminoadipic semialdehyde synthase
VCVATNLLGEAQQLAIRYGQEHNNVKYRIVDVTRKETYEYLVDDADLVIRYDPSNSADRSDASLLTN